MRLLCSPHPFGIDPDTSDQDLHHLTFVLDIVVALIALIPSHRKRPNIPYVSHTADDGAVCTVGSVWRPEVKSGWACCC